MTKTKTIEFKNSAAWAGRVRRAAVLVAMVASVWSSGSAAAAGDDKRLRVAVIVAGSADRALLDRLYGQTSDLDVELVDVAVSALEPNLRGRLDAADHMAASRGARVVVWLEVASGEADRAAVYICEPATGRVFVRELRGEQTQDGVRSGPAGTATLEAAALVIREALRALAEGVVIGVRRDELVPDSPPPSLPAPVGSSPEPESEPEPFRLRWLAGAGWQLAFDGVTPSGQQAVAVRLGARTDALHLALVGAAGLATELRDGPSTLELRRHTVALAAGGTLPMAGSLAARMELCVGVVVFQRRTITAGAGLQRVAEGTAPSLLVGPEMALSWLPPFAGGRIAFEFGAAVDFVPGAPILGYDGGSGFEPRQTLWRIQPRILLGVVGWGR